MKKEKNQRITSTGQIVNDFVPKRIKNHGENLVSRSINEISVTRGGNEKKNLLFRSG